MAIVDFVNWSPQDDLTVYAHKFPGTNLSTYTQLVVQESQEAVLFSKGQIIGKFGPGKHTLNTENLPVLRSLYGLPFGGKNPFMAEVWFVNKIEYFDIDWQIDNMNTHDVDYNANIPLIAKGRYGLKITDAEKFLIKIVGTKTDFTEVELTRQFFGEFSTKTKSGLMQFMATNKIGLKQISAYLDTISEHLRSAMIPFWENIGFDLTKFYITSIEVDNLTESGRRILDAISRQSAQSISGYTWQQSQAFEVAKDAVNDISNNKGGGGLLGALVASNMMGGLAGGSILQPQYNQPSFNPNSSGQQTGSQQSPSAVRDVYCSNCSKKFSSNLNFCPHCGDEYCPCPKCGTDNDKSAKRCVSCGQVLASNLCQYCNSPIPDGAAFCGNCGKTSNSGACVRCGFQITPGTKFCPKCGQKNVNT